MFLPVSGSETPQMSQDETDPRVGPDNFQTIADSGRMHEDRNPQLRHRLEDFRRRDRMELQALKPELTDFAGEQRPDFTRFRLRVVLGEADESVRMLPDITGDLFVRLLIRDVADGKDDGALDACLFRLPQHPLRVVIGRPRVTRGVVLAVIRPFARMAVRIDHATRRLRWPGLSSCGPMGECEGATNQHAASDKITPIHDPFLPGAAHVLSSSGTNRGVMDTRPARRRKRKKSISE